MKGISKNKILFVTISIIVLAVTLLLQRLGSEKKSLDQINSTISTLHNQKSDMLPVKPIEKTPPIETAVSPIIKSSPSDDMDMPALDDIVAPEEIVRSTMILNFYKGMGLKIEPLANPPGTVVLKRQPKVGEKLTYRQVIITCDEDGEPVSSKSGTGLQNQLTGHVIKVDPNHETYIVEWRSEPYLGVMGKNAEVMFLEDTRGKMWKEKMSFRDKPLYSSESEQPLLKNIDRGDYPQFEYPDVSLAKGESWTLISGNNEENLTKVEVKGFANVNGRSCIVLQLSTHIETTVNITPRNRNKELSVQLEVDSKGLRYVDYETGVIVAEDIVNLSYANGIANRIRYVKQMISSDTHDGS